MRLERLRFRWQSDPERRTHSVRAPEAMCRPGLPGELLGAVMEPASLGDVSAGTARDEAVRADGDPSGLVENVAGEGPGKHGYVAQAAALVVGADGPLL